MITDESLAQLRRLMEARVKRDESKKQSETDEKEYRDIEADVYESLEQTQIKGSVKVDLGPPFGIVSFSPRETYFGKVYDKEAAVVYFEERAMIDEISEPKFSMKRIHEIVRDCVEQGVKPPPGVDHYARRGVTITRQK